MPTILGEQGGVPNGPQIVSENHHRCRLECVRQPKPGADPHRSFSSPEARGSSTAAKAAREPTVASL